MMRLTIRWLFLLALAAVATPAQAARSGRGPESIMRCATPEPTRSEAEQCRSAVHDFQRESEPQHGGTIRVVVHVLTCEGKGQVTNEQINTQIDVLNDAYRESGFRFALDRIDRTEDCSWAYMTPGSSSEREAKA